MKSPVITLAPENEQSRQATYLELRRPGHPAPADQGQPREDEGELTAWLPKSDVNHTGCPKCGQPGCQHWRTREPEAIRTSSLRGIFVLCEDNHSACMM